MQKIPGVDKLLINEEIKELIGLYGAELVTFSIRKALDEIRANILAGDKSPELNDIVSQIKILTRMIGDKSLIEVINGTGIVLHTNLGRALLGDHILEELKPIVSNYSNLEFDLKTGRRGQRNSHISELIKFVTQAEDAVVVNNNAAAVMLILKTFAEGKEVIISRGELIEIGGSFRIPEIMEASGCKMIEVGATNRTRLSDYENAITKDTALIFKAHKSNYYIDGFTEEVELSDLSDLARKHKLLFVYDLGSGLLRKPEGLSLENEPDVRSSLQAGCDIISFSGDKLLGGPQAGIIAGRSNLIQRITKAPMMRALRVGKMTIAALSAVMRFYLKDEDLLSKVPIFEMLNRKKIDLKNLADKLKSEFEKFSIKSEITESKAQCGGGTLPQLRIDSLAVKIIHKGNRNYAKELHKKLLELDKPILGILREGNLLFDLLTLSKEDIPIIAKALNSINNSED